MFGKHRSLDKSVKHSVIWLQSMLEIKRIILGIATACRHRYAPGTLKVKAYLPSGLRINAYSGTGVMSIYLHIAPASAKELVAQRLLTKFK